MKDIMLRRVENLQSPKTMRTRSLFNELGRTQQLGPSCSGVRSNCKSSRVGDIGVETKQLIRQQTPPPAITQGEPLWPRAMATPLRSTEKERIWYLILRSRYTISKRRESSINEDRMLSETQKPTVMKETAHVLGQHTRHLSQKAMPEMKKSLSYKLGQIICKIRRQGETREMLRPSSREEGAHIVPKRTLPNTTFGNFDNKALQGPSGDAVQPNFFARKVLEKGYAKGAQPYRVHKI